jgi:hypothetical protein
VYSFVSILWLDLVLGIVLDTVHASVSSVSTLL